VNQCFGNDEIYGAGDLYVFGIAFGQNYFLSQFFHDGGIISVG
jgi:hypothetical protein